MVVLWCGLACRCWMSTWGVRHASIESTRIYLHPGDDWLASQYRQAAEAIDAQALAAAAVPGAAVTGPALLPGWPQLAEVIPQVAVPDRTMTEPPIGLTFVELSSLR